MLINCWERCSRVVAGATGCDGVHGWAAFLQEEGASLGALSFLAGFGFPASSIPAVPSRAMKKTPVIYFFNMVVVFGLDENSFENVTVYLKLFLRHFATSFCA